MSDFRQTYTTVLNPVISPKLRVARFSSTLRQSYDLHTIRLKLKKKLCCSKNILQIACHCLTPTSCKTYDSLIPQLLRNMVKKTSSGWQEINKKCLTLRDAKRINGIQMFLALRVYNVEEREKSKYFLYMCKLTINQTKKQRNLKLPGCRNSVRLALPDGSQCRNTRGKQRIYLQH